MPVAITDEIVTLLIGDALTVHCELVGIAGVAGFVLGLQAPELAAALVSRVKPGAPAQTNPACAKVATRTDNRPS